MQIIPVNSNKVLDSLRSLHGLDLNLDEVVATKAAEVVSNLRKSSDKDVSTAAKRLRMHWKEVCTFQLFRNSLLFSADLFDVDMAVVDFNA